MFIDFQRKFNEIMSDYRPSEIKIDYDSIRANGRAILAEAGDARVSQSVTLDRTRSHLNQYTNYSNGFEAWDEMEKQANEYQTTFTDKNGVQRNRKLKSDAVWICCYFQSTRRRMFGMG